MAAAMTLTDVDVEALTILTEKDVEELARAVLSRHVADAVPDVGAVTTWQVVEDAMAYRLVDADEVRWSRRCDARRWER
jgi:predicted TIM-barrel enzyme